MKKIIDYFGISILITISGVFLVGFSSDTFRLFYYWIGFALSWYYTSQKNMLELKVEI